MARQSIEKSLERIKLPSSRESVESFYNFARGKLTLETLGESSWKKTIKVLADWENFGSGEDRHSSLINYYELWREEEE